MAPIGQETAAPSDSASGPSGTFIARIFERNKITLQVSEITIASATGAVTASTDPNVKGNFIDPDGVTFDRAKRGIYFSRIQRDKTKKNYLTHVAGAVNDTNGGQHIIIVKLDLNPAYQILKNYYGLGVSRRSDRGPAGRDLEKG